MKLTTERGERRDYADIGRAPGRTRNATDREVMDFSREVGVRQADMLRFGLAERGLFATTRRIRRLLREDRAARAHSEPSK